MSVYPVIKTNYGVPESNKTYHLDTPINTGRYLWHVSYPYLKLQKSELKEGEYESIKPYIVEEDGIRIKLSRSMKIQQEGLKTPQNWAVFAHNKIREIVSMYPIWIDKVEQFFRCEDHELNRGIKNFQWLRDYDFWRIDTKVFKEKWYIDPVMKNDLQLYRKLNSVSSNYVCTTVDIPGEALTLFRFDPDICDSIVNGKGSNKTEEVKLLERTISGR
jgi:hypothetical protein